MSLTLGLTGMDPATEAALKAAFIEANARLGERWSLVPDAQAGHIVVDMDSMYGPMSWLRLHAAGRQVIGLTSAPRTQTDYRLGRPFDPGQLVELLVDVARGMGIELQQASAGPPPATTAGSTTDPAPAPATEVAAVPPAGDAPAPAVAPDPAPAPAPVPEPAPSPVPSAPLLRAASEPQAAQASPEDDISGDAAESPDATPADALAASAAPTLPAEGALAAWLRPGAMTGRLRYRRDGHPTLLVDASNDSWFGPAQLKPLASTFGHGIGTADFEPVDSAEWARETASAGAPQPLSRLRWFDGLLAGGGALLPGLDPASLFQLNKWPQTEREYPRHFRIATQMMKGPATVAAIAAASGVPEADVADFVNANLATGFAEPVRDEPPRPEEPPKPRVGLLGRLRNR
ncbi:hypothetical protein WCE41_08030 [Luteimonas sp. MJ246]|uniref:hypothetical protein n=1 Tax=Luteimonas sp. MJ174 TaxID=3129237 RepID=UPI0031BA40BE